MPFCSSCGAEQPASARFCSACAAPLAAAPDSVSAFDAPTELAPESSAPAAPSSATRRTPVSGPSDFDDGRFLPGTVLDGRYRIGGVIGRGGMGEVYRADDLKLGQRVALKFLPEDAERDDEWLTRFLNEVKVARQISHPGVCRVHDVGEVEGHHYLSMELIDGEDLGSLLRRIGRLPQSKAVQIARQICAGLAAAHDQGVLHRDLKPANVMIDGRGDAKITDFGLAGVADMLTQEDAFSGTPAYMAPEQLAGREVTFRSDLYALGLVLYQLFTGKPAFKGKTLEEISRARNESTPADPTTVVDGLDPAVAGAILRCLERDPAKRPPSALAVAAALPGGDPLAAALGGEIVWFRLIGPWSRAERDRRRALTVTDKVNRTASLVLFLGVFGAAVWAARRNVRAGRGDVRGATRLALALGLLGAVNWVLVSHHVGDLPSELGLFIVSYGLVLVKVGLAWVLYVALEPFVRRHDPQKMVAWTRLLAGRWRDPLVGRDVLIGAAVALGVAHTILVVIPAKLALGRRPLPASVWHEAAGSPRIALGYLVDLLTTSIFTAMFFTFLWFLLYRLTRRRWAAVTLLLLVFTGLLATQDPTEVGLLVALAFGGALVWILARFGLLAMIAMLTFLSALSSAPLSLDWGQWQVRAGWLVVAALALVVGTAWRVSQGGRAAEALP